MSSPKLLICIALVIFGSIVSTKSVYSQLNCFSYSNDLGEYDSVSSDGTVVYTTVVIDGSQEMNAWGQCAQFVGYAVHTASAFNQLRTSQQNVGGWQNDSGVCASCYISFGNDEYITPLPSEQIDFITESMAVCSFGSTIFDSGYNDAGIGIHRATYEAEPRGTGCHLTLTCPAGTRAVCGTSPYDIPVACGGTWLNLAFVSVTNARNNSLSCFGLGKNIWSYEQGVCD